MSNEIWPSTYGAGGGCDNDTQARIYGNPGVGIATLNKAVSLLQAMAFGITGISGMGARGGTQPPEPPEAACDVFVGVVTRAPTYGYGPATVQKISINSDGTWRASGDSVTVVIPRI